MSDIRVSSNEEFSLTSEAEYLKWPGRDETGPQAVAVLTERLQPIATRALAHECWRRLGLDLFWQKNDNDTQRHGTEYLRLMAEDGTYGLRYYVKKGEQYGIIFLRNWVRRDFIFNPYKPTRVFVTAGMLFNSGVHGCTVAPYLKNKYNSTPEKCGERTMAGITIEDAVRCYFAKHWPDLYVPPSNVGTTRPAVDDFSLRKWDKRPFTVDVAGPNADGEYGKVPGKKCAQVHILASFAEKPTDTSTSIEVLMYGWCSGATFGLGLNEKLSLPMEQMFVMLNCSRLGINYRKLASVL